MIFSQCLSSFYGTIITLGMIITFCICLLFDRQKKENLEDLSIFIYCCAFIGGKLFYFIFDNTEIIVFSLANILGGFSLLGASFFSIIGLKYFIKKNKLSHYSFVYLPICALILHAFGRIACLYAGCCSGHFYGMSVPVASASLYGVGFFIGLFLYKKNYIKYLDNAILYYGFFIFFDRLLFDVYRDDKIVIFRGITKYQILAIIYFISVFFIIQWHSRRR